VAGLANRTFRGILRRKRANRLHEPILPGPSNLRRRGCDSRCSNPRDVIGYLKRGSGCPNGSCCLSCIPKLPL
jgi:hypothetical protein